MGTRTGQGHQFIAESDGRQPGLAPGQSPQHARLGRWQYRDDRQLSQTAAAERRGKGDDSSGVESEERIGNQAVVLGEALDRRSAVAAGERTPRIAADREY